jgi:hypothetical protein
MTTTIYAEAAGDESSTASAADDCDANTCFYCAGPETD